MGLVVYNTNTAITFDVDYLSFDEVVTRKDEIKASAEEAGFTATNFKNTTYNGVKILSYEIKMDGVSMLYYVAETSSQNNVFFGSAFNSSYTIDYSILNTVANVVKNTKQSGTTFSKSKDEKNVKTGFNKNAKNFKF